MRLALECFGGWREPNLLSERRRVRPPTLYEDPRSYSCTSSVTATGRPVLVSLGSAHSTSTHTYAAGSS
jgi:hypothetical protein